MPSEMLKLAAEKGMESDALNPKAGDIPTFADKRFLDVGSDVPRFEKDLNIPKFADDGAKCRTDAHENDGVDGSCVETESRSGETSQNAEVDPDARIDDNGNSEKVEEGYKSWDDVPHSTDPETGRERYELQSGKDTGALNSVPPPPNADIYVSDADGGNFTKVETDDKGRIVRISRPRIELSDKSQRTNETLQTVDKKDGRRDENGNKTDDGGHLVADEFGGSSEETNLVPMDSEVNRHGEWRKMERDIEKELNKEPPSEIKDFEVDLEYDDDTSRPSGFTVTYTVDDGKTQTEVTKYIRNERPEREDIRNAA